MGLFVGESSYALTSPSACIIFRRRPSMQSLILGATTLSFLFSSAHKIWHDDAFSRIYRHTSFNFDTPSEQFGHQIVYHPSKCTLQGSLRKILRFTIVSLDTRTRSKYWCGSERRRHSKNRSAYISEKQCSLEVLNKSNLESHLLFGSRLRKCFYLVAAVAEGKFIYFLRDRTCT